MVTRNVIAASLLTLSVATSAHAGAPTELSQSQVGTPATAPAPRAPTAAFGSRAEAARYAARETASPGAGNYRAGDVVVISASALAIILLIILIIVLI